MLTEDTKVQSALCLSTIDGTDADETDDEETEDDDKEEEKEPVN